jgi:hypothetical protein
MARRPFDRPSIVRLLRNAVALSLLLAAARPGPLRAQVASQGVNMVSGIQWPGGDPFLQRQNEPSIAMSSRNPRHLLAGANDYRTVDIPFPPSPVGTPPETGDAWLGVFKSFDGGLTWKSTLLPGYPQQPGGATGPLANFTTAADPVVRAGTNGLFYYSGIAFNRGTNVGVLFVSRFMDLNNKENGDPTLDSDPIRYIDTQIVERAVANSSPFIDKPWIAVDKPRLLDGVCNLTVPQPGNGTGTVKQSVPAGSVYAAWTEATGTSTSTTSTKILFSYSRDCGGSWSKPQVISGTNTINQGASIAIDPATGVINVVWRRFASGSQTDAIMIARSGRGLLFSTPTVVASLPPYSAATLTTGKSFFDQGTSTDSLRTNAYPTIGIDRRPDAGTEDVDEPDTATYRGRIFVAWSQRMPPNGDARVVLSVSTDGASTWSAPQPIDNSSVTDDSGTSFSRGHQFMPQMTVTADKITVIYYDARLDHTFGLFTPRVNPLTPDPVTGKLYLETRQLEGELLDPLGANIVFTPFFRETGLTKWRHTLDLRVAQADSAVSPVFTSARLSQYIFGTRGGPDQTQLSQLQINPPNLPLFQQGTVPFIGDYIDVAGPTFLPPSAPGGRWRFNSLPGTNPVFLASWTSNQDVRPPADGQWWNYTPPTTTNGRSVFDGSTLPACRPGNEGMRNQNIYAARISQGLAVTSVQNAKPLSTSIQRALTVNVENLTPLSRAFRLTIAGQPAGGRASFVPAPNPPTGTLPAPTTTLDVTIPPVSSIARSVYALSTNPTALIEVDVAELSGAPGSSLKTNGLTGFVIFNSDPSAPTLINPDNATGVATFEIYNPNVTNPNVTNPNVTNPNVTNPNVTNPNVTNPNVTNPNVTNPNVTNPNVTNPDLANPNVTNPNVTNPNVTNPNVTNPNVTNPNVTNPNVTNAPVSDATYTVTNTGNTAASYRVQLAGTAPAAPLQLIITKPYANPASLNCVLFEQQHNLPVANVINPQFSSTPNPNITDPSDGNATFVLGPGESILVTLRGPVDVPTLTNIIQNVAPVVVAHAPNSNDTSNKPATSPPSITTSVLPDGVAGQAYSATLTALGGTPPYVGWAATGLPAILSIGGTTTGLISGTPTAAGTSSVTVSVTDSAYAVPPAPPGKTGSRTYSLRIAPPLAITTAALPNAVVNSTYSQTLASTGGTAPVAWAITSGSLPAGLSLAAATGTIGGAATTVGTYNFTAQATDSNNPAQVKTQSLQILVATPLVISTTTLPNAVANSPYTQSLASTGGTGAVTWTISAGSLPSPLMLTGAFISGTPPTAGTYSFTVKATDSATPPQVKTQALTIVVATPLVISTTTLPNAVANSPYTQTLASTGGTGAVTWTISAGSLPSGLTLSGASISGTPATAGSYPFTAQTTDSASPPQVKTQSLTIVVASPLVISTTSLPNAVVGSSYSQTLASTGGTAPVAWAITSGLLPAGLSLAAATGTIGGTPNTTGTYGFTVKATDSATPPQVQTQALTIVVAPPLVITTTALPSVVAGTASYTQMLASTGGTAPVGWAIASGLLPPGLSLSGATISGTPTTAGSYPFTAQATDSTSPAQVKTQSLTIVVIPILGITTSSLPNGSLGAAYSQTLAATGGLGTLTWSLATGSQPLPPGISLSTAGVLSGTPTTNGTYPFTVQVADSGSPQQTATASLAITVGCGDPIALAASVSAANTAGGPQTINLAAGCVYTFTTGSAGDPSTALPHINGNTNLTINGNGATIQRSSAPGTPAFRLLAVDGGGTLTLNNVTISNGGCTLPCATDVEGGGVYNLGTLNVVLSNFTSNNAGGDATNSRGGAIESYGALKVDQSTFTSNQAQNNGGAIFNWGGTLTVTNSTFASNTAQNVGGAIVAFSANASTVTNSTFVGNTASRLFWGGTETGSAIYNQNLALWLLPPVPPSGPLTVTSSTFAGNGANGTIATETGVTTTLRNTILTGSAGTNCGGSGAATDGGYNISSDASCALFVTETSLNGTDPQLDSGGLSSAGGPTQVVVPLPGSPAVDAIPPGTNGCGTTLTTDQRGAMRPTGARCDIGSVEFPPILYGWTTLSNIKLNGGTNVLTVPAGQAFNLSYDYTIANPPDYCPGCIDQIEIGFVVGVPVCTYDGQPNPPQSGTTSTSFTAPSTPGVYYLAMDWSLDWGCFQPVTPGVTVPPYWHSPPTPNRYIGKVIVPVP